MYTVYVYTVLYMYIQKLLYILKLCFIINILCRILFCIILNTFLLIFLITRFLLKLNKYVLKEKENITYLMALTILMFIV